MGKLIDNRLQQMNTILNPSLSPSANNYQQYATNLLQQKIDSEWAYATDKFTIQEELVMGSNIYTDTEVRITHVIEKASISTNSSTILGDDFRNLIFKDINHSYGLGYRYSFDNNIWLTIFSDIYHYPTASSSVRRCQYKIKWYGINSNGQQQLYEEPAVVDTILRTGLGINLNAVMQTLDAKLMIVVQQNEATRTLNINQRIMLKGQDAYIITHRDMTTKDNLITFILKQDMYNPATDDGDLLVCDVPKAYELRIINNNSTVSMGSTLQILSELYDTTSNNVVDGTTFTYVSNNTDIATVDSNGIITPVAIGDGTITVSSNGVNNTFNYTVEAVITHNYTSSITGSLSDKLNNSYTYTANFFDNGNPITDIGIWSLTADDGVSSTTWATIMSTTSTTCTIQITSTYIFNDGTAKYIKLHCKGVTVTNDTYIRIKLTT